MTLNQTIEFEQIAMVCPTDNELSIFEYFGLVQGVTPPTPLYQCMDCRESYPLPTLKETTNSKIEYWRNI